MLKIVLLISIFYVTHADRSLRIAFEPFSVLTNSFLTTTQPKDGNLAWIFENILNPVFINGSSINYQSSYTNQLLLNYVGYLILLIIGVLFILFFTLIGCICFCCKTCCHPKDRKVAHKNQKVIRIVFQVIIIIFTSLMVMGAIISIVSTIILLESLGPKETSKDPERNIQTDIINSINYIKLFIFEIVNNLKTTAVSAINESLNTIVVNLNNSLVTSINLPVTIFMNEIQKIESNSTLILTYFDQMKLNATNLKSASSEHQAFFKEFESNIITSKAEIQNIINTSCPNTSCIQGMTNYNFFININITKIAYLVDQNLINILNNISTAQFSNSLNTLTEIRKNFTAKSIEETQKNILKLNSTIFNLNIQEIVINVGNDLGQFLNSSIQNYGNLYTNYYTEYIINNYPNIEKGCYGFAGFLGIILLICLFFYIGLGFGICGGPNFEDSSCCNKAVGRSFYLTSFGLSVFFCWLYMIITIVFFIVGGFSYTEICRYISPNSSSKYHKVLDDEINTILSTQKLQLGKVSVSLPKLELYTGLVEKCPTGQSIRQSFVVPIEFEKTIINITNEQYIQPSIKDIIGNISQILPETPDFGTIKSEIKKLDDQFDKISNPEDSKTLIEIQKPVLGNFNLTVFESAMNNTVYILKNISKTVEATKLEVEVKKVIDAYKKMEALQINYFNFKSKVMELNNNINKTFDYVKTDIDGFAGKVRQSFTEVFSKLSKDIPSLIVSSLETTIGKTLDALGNCVNMYKSLDSVINSYCIDFLNPFNNIWLGIGIFLLFIIFTIIFAMSVSNTYLVSHIQRDYQYYNTAYMGNSEFKIDRPETA